MPPSDGPSPDPSRRTDLRPWVVAVPAVLGVVAGAAVAAVARDDPAPVPTTYGAAEILVGGGDLGVPTRDGAVEGTDLLLQVAAPDTIDDPDVVGARGIGVDADGTVTFSWANHLAVVDPTGHLTPLGWSTPAFFDVAVTADRGTVGAPVLRQLQPGQVVHALAGVGPEQEVENIGPLFTGTPLDGGRVAVGADASLIRTSNAGLVWVAPDGTVTDDRAPRTCDPGASGVAPTADGGAWVGARRCSAIERVGRDGTSNLVVSQRDPSSCWTGATFRGQAGDEDGPAGVQAFGLAVDPDGRLWVADPYCGTIEYLEDGALVPVPRRIAGLDGPIDLGFDADGNLYVLDAGRRALLRIARTDLPSLGPPTG